MKRNLLMLIILLIFLTACEIAPSANKLDVSRYVNDLNERQVTSCIEVQVAVSPYGWLKLTTATGGATIEDCRRHRDGF